MFYAGGLGYFGQYIALAQLSSQTQQASHHLAAGFGTFGYEPNVRYFFGFPQAITPGGIALDMRVTRVLGNKTQDPEAYKNLSLQTGILSSTLEHAVPEQLFTTDPNNPVQGVSAVKAIQLAQQQGQRIYHITQANKATALPNIGHNIQTMNDIQNALAVGKEVITHTNPISVPGWTGAGYIIFDPDTGEGAYRITGGGNGGYFNEFGTNMSDLMNLFGQIEMSEWLKKFKDHIQNFIDVVLDNLTNNLGKLTVAITDTLDKLKALSDIVEKCGVTSAAIAYASITMMAGAFTVLTGASFTANIYFGIAVGMLGSWAVAELTQGWINNCKPL